MEHWTEYTRFLTALLVILDPFAVIPIFLAMTSLDTPEQRKQIATISVATVFCVLILAAVLGEPLLIAMGTSLASFRVGGGIVLLLMSLSMLQAQFDTMRTTPDERSEAQDRSSVAIVPLAIPLLAGPGSISTVIIQMHRSQLHYHGHMVVLCILVACLLLWLALRMAQTIGRVLGQTGLNIINRLFGLILAAIAIEIMANGLKQLFPALS